MLKVSDADTRRKSLKDAGLLGKKALPKKSNCIKAPPSESESDADFAKFYNNNKLSLAFECWRQRKVDLDKRRKI